MKPLIRPPSERNPKPSTGATTTKNNGSGRRRNTRAIQLRQTLVLQEPQEPLHLLYLRDAHVNERSRESVRSPPRNHIMYSPSEAMQSTIGTRRSTSSPRRRFLPILRDMNSCFVDDPYQEDSCDCFYCRERTSNSKHTGTSTSITQSPVSSRILTSNLAPSSSPFCRCNPSAYLPTAYRHVHSQVRELLGNIKTQPDRVPQVLATGFKSQKSKKVSLPL
jgi:hypothetical protein